MGWGWGWGFNGHRDGREGLAVDLGRLPVGLEVDEIPDERLGAGGRRELAHELEDAARERHQV